MAMPVTIPTATDVASSIDEFRRSLKSEPLEAVVAHVVSKDTCFCIDQDTCRAIIAQIEKYFGKTKLEVAFVGSAKLGFSITAKSDKVRYRPFSREICLMKFGRRSF